MKTAYFLAVTALLALPLAAPAQVAVPTIPAAPAPQAVALRYKFVPGQMHRYQMTMTMKGLMLTGQSGAGLPLNSSMRLIFQQTVKEVRASDGAATLVAQIEEVHSLMNGQETALPEAQQAKMKQPYTIVMLPTGKMLSADIPSLNASALPGMDMSKGLFSGSAFLPDGPVKIGDTWNGVAASPMVGMQMTSVSTLAGLEQKNGASLATITQTQKGTIYTTMSKGLPVTMKMLGTVTGIGTQVFDATAGAIQSATGTTNTLMTMTFGKSASGTSPAGLPQQMKMEMKAEVSMQRLDDVPPPSPATL